MRKAWSLLAFVLLGLSSLLAQFNVHPQVSGTTAQLRGISAVSGQIAWASGTEGTVLRTLDAGNHWENVSVPGAEKLDFRDVQAFDAGHAFVMSIGNGDQSKIYKTSDGGRSWKLLFTNPDPRAFYDCFAFWDRTHGIAMSDSVEGKFPLLMTADGETWKLLEPKTLPAALPNEGGFAGKRDVWFVTGGPAARVFHSADRGGNWEVLATPIVSGAATQGIFSVTFTDSLHGVIAGGDYKEPKAADKNVAWTSDGGKSWKLAVQPPGGYRSAVTYIPSPVRGRTVLVAAGTSGADYSLDFGKTWEPIDGGDYNAISFGGSFRGWAVGPKGRIVSLEWRSQFKD
jgi:photosystem II stability/assembly factor-like uncharacterized protein